METVGDFFLRIKMLAIKTLQKASQEDRDFESLSRMLDRVKLEESLTDTEFTFFLYHFEKLLDESNEFLERVERVKAVYPYLFSQD